jgi:hypothetical protein
MGGEWSASRPGPALPPGKVPPVPIVQEAGWAAEPVWTQRIEEKSFAPAGDRTPVVQPVVRHYTAWATRLLFIRRTCGPSASLLIVPKSTKARSGLSMGRIWRSVEIRDRPKSTVTSLTWEDTYSCSNSLPRRSCAPETVGLLDR